MQHKQYTFTRAVQTTNFCCAILSKQMCKHEKLINNEQQQKVKLNKYTYFLFHNKKNSIPKAYLLNIILSFVRHSFQINFI